MKDLKGGWSADQFSCKPCELWAICRAILFFDVVQKIFHVIELDVAEEVQ